MELIVRSTVIDWQEETLTITDTGDEKHTVPLDQVIRVTMVGYQEKETSTMLARDLGAFMSKGYIIEKIALEVEDKA